MLLYAFCWLAYGLAWWHWGLERPSGEFADLDDAWTEATGALANAAIDIQELPIYLILGRPTSGEANLFQAAGIELVLPPTPARLGAPLHVCASRDAIYITCAASSLLGQVSHEVAAPQSSAPRPENDLAGQGQTTARLQYLCRLLGKQRKPYCPINGMVLLVPWKGLASNTAAAAIAERVHLDVGVVHEALRVDCPFFIMVCDLETVPGFREFLSELPAHQRTRSLGQTFPLVPDVDPHEVPNVIAQGIASLGDDVLSEAICGRLHPGIGAQADNQPPAPLQLNRRLYQLFAHLRRGCQHIAHVINRGTQTNLAAPTMVAGCYLAATGADPAGEQAFVAEVFQDLSRSQNFVAWSPQALAAEAGYRRRTRLGYLALALLLAGVGYLIAFGRTWPFA